MLAENRHKQHPALPAFSSGRPDCGAGEVNDESGYTCMLVNLHSIFEDNDQLCDGVGPSRLLAM